MNVGDKVIINNNVFGEKGKTGAIVAVYKSDNFGLLYDVRTGETGATTYRAKDVALASSGDTCGMPNIKEAVDFDRHVFIESKPVVVSKDDAYRRKTITDEIIELWHNEINATDTSGLSSEHKEAYDNAVKALDVVIAHELVLICS